MKTAEQICKEITDTTSLMRKHAHYRLGEIWTGEDHIVMCARQAKLDQLSQDLANLHKEQA